MKGIERLRTAEDLGLIRVNEPLWLHSRWRIGGVADLFIEPLRADQIARACACAEEENVALVIVGNGSNLLFSDAGLRGAVLKIGRKFSRYTVKDNVITAQAGAWVPALARTAARMGLSGLEHAAGIPGTLGGLIYMNGGSLRHSIGEIVRRVWAMDRFGNVKVMHNAECAFSYRRSIFQDADLVILQAELICQPDDPSRIRQRTLEILKERKRKFPLKLPNCGSVFSNHPELYSNFGPPGKVIEDLGLKGFAVGGVQVSQKHANFIVNLGSGKAADVFKLVSLIRAATFRRTGIYLECEVRYVDERGRLGPLHTFLDEAN